MINWKIIKKFTPEEFSEDPTIYSKPQTIYDLDTLRFLLGYSINPSKAKGAVARFSGDTLTRHYAFGRKSDALDIFCNCTPSYTFNIILVSRLFNGIGVYFDTNNNQGEIQVMFHIDQRPLKINGLPTIWYRDNNGYHYPGDVPEKFYNELMNRLINRMSIL